MNIIAFHPTTNTNGKNDAGGAFIPEATHFMSFHKQLRLNRIPIDNTKTMSEMQTEVIRAIRSCHDLDAVAFFCHGFKSGIQLGFRNGDVQYLAHVLSETFGINSPGIVTLYACDAARDADQDREDDLQEFGGDGGFADLLRDALCKEGKLHCRVDAHASAAHTTMNPDVRRFEGGGSLGAVGGSYIMPRGTPLWSKWVAALKTDFRYEFPYLTTQEIHQRLG